MFNRNSYYSRKDKELTVVISHATDAFMTHSLNISLLFVNKKCVQRMVMTMEAFLVLIVNINGAIFLFVLRGIKIYNGFYQDVKKSYLSLWFPETEKDIAWNL